MLVMQLHHNAKQVHCGIECEDQDERAQIPKPNQHCLLYTSDAADERSSVDLGGRRIIKKKKNIQKENKYNIRHQ